MEIHLPINRHDLPITLLLLFYYSFISLQAVMEAAISSTLSHPNIVATYTYSIKPVRDTTVAAPASKPTVAVPGVVVANADGTLAESIAMAKALPAAPTPIQSVVHSFEVRLILEFCDSGCLRDILETQVGLR